MSYSAKFRVHGGKIVNTQVFGELPDGQFEVNGHEEDAGYKSIHVTRYGTDGKHAVSATHSEPGSYASVRELLPVPEDE